MESHPVHRHSWEEMLIIKDGDVEVSINGHKQHAGPGALVFLAANDPHNARNVGTKPATYYVINFVTDLSHSTSDKSAAEQAVPGKLASSVLDCNSMPSTPTPQAPASSALARPPSPSSRLKVTSPLSTPASRPPPTSSTPTTRSSSSNPARSKSPSTASPRA